MRYAIIENNLVANIAEASGALAANWIEDDGTAIIGGTYDGASFGPIPPAPVVVPESVSPRQVRQALTRVNMRQLVEDSITTADQDIKDWWEFATKFERNHPHLVQMAAAMGISDDQIDDIFLLAGSL